MRRKLCNLWVFIVCITMGLDLDLIHTVCLTELKVLGLALLLLHIGNLLYFVHYYIGGQQ